MDHVLTHDGIKLKSAFAGAIRLLRDGYSAACDPVADLEAYDVGADLDDGARNVGS